MIAKRRDEIIIIGPIKSVRIGQCCVIRYRFSKLNGKRNTNEICTRSDEKRSEWRRAKKKEPRSTEAHERELRALQKKSWLWIILINFDLELGCSPVAKKIVFFSQFFGHMVFSHTSSIWTYKLCKYWLYFDFFSLFIPLLMALNFQRFFSSKKMCLHKEINIKVTKKTIHLLSLSPTHKLRLLKSMELIHLHLCSICLILIPFEYKTITGNRVATSYLKLFCCFCCWLSHTHTRVNRASNFNDVLYR